MDYEICRKMKCPYCKKDYVNPELMYCAKIGCGADEREPGAPKDCPYSDILEQHEEVQQD